jgi:hypothetical protein
LLIPMTKSRAENLCPKCGKNGFLTVGSFRRRWKMKNPDKLRYHLSKYDIEQIADKTKNAILKEEIVDDEKRTFHYGNYYEYYRFGHYDSQKYKKELADFQAGKRRSRPNGRTWCSIAPYLQIHEIKGRPILPENKVYVKIFDWVSANFYHLAPIMEELFPEIESERNFSQLHIVTVKLFKKIHDDELNRYVIPVPKEIQEISNELLSIQEGFTKALQGIAPEMSDPENLGIAEMKKFRSIILNFATVCMAIEMDLMTHITAYHWENIRIHRRISRKRINQLINLRIRGLDPILEPRSKEESLKVGFLGIQCSKCSSWRVDEIYESTSYRSYRCFACNNIVRNQRISL